MFSSSLCPPPPPQFTHFPQLPKLYLSWAACLVGWGVGASRNNLVVSHGSFITCGCTQELPLPHFHSVQAPIKYSLPQGCQAVYQIAQNILTHFCFVVKLPTPGAEPAIQFIAVCLGVSQCTIVCLQSAKTRCGQWRHNGSEWAGPKCTLLCCFVRIPETGCYLCHLHTGLKPGDMGFGGGSVAENLAPRNSRITFFVEYNIIVLLCACGLRVYGHNLLQKTAEKCCRLRSRPALDGPSNNADGKQSSATSWGHAVDVSGQSPLPG